MKRPDGLKPRYILYVMVFDTTVSTVGDFRARFERHARESWHAQLMPKR